MMDLDDLKSVLSSPINPKITNDGKYRLGISTCSHLW